MANKEHLLTPEDRAALCEFLRSARPKGSEIQQWFAGRGMRISANAAGGVRARLMSISRPCQGYEGLRVERVLRAEDREAYHALLDLPATRLRDAFEWLRARGYGGVVGHCAVCRHRRRFLERRRAMRESAELGAELARVARGQGSAALTDGALTTFEQVLMEQLRLLNLKETVDPKALAALTHGVATAVVGRHKLESLRVEIERRARTLARVADRAAARKNATPQDVAERMRQILGLQTKAKPLPG